MLERDRNHISHQGFGRTLRRLIAGLETKLLQRSRNERIITMNAENEML